MALIQNNEMLLQSERRVKFFTRKMNNYIKYINECISENSKIIEYQENLTRPGKIDYHSENCQKSFIYFYKICQNCSIYYSEGFKDLPIIEQVTKCFSATIEKNQNSISDFQEKYNNDMQFMLNPNKPESIAEFNKRTEGGQPFYADIPEYPFNDEEPASGPFPRLRMEGKPLLSFDLLTDNHPDL
jgi:hypothetical protein